MYGRKPKTKLNPCHVTGIFLYPPKNIGKPQAFRRFQGVQKETSGMKWVIRMYFKTKPIPHICTLTSGSKTLYLRVEEDHS